MKVASFRFNWTVKWIADFDSITPPILNVDVELLVGDGGCCHPVETSDRRISFCWRRFIDHETVSLQSSVSLGRVGRVPGGDIKLSTSTSRPGSRESVASAAAAAAAAAASAAASSAATSAGSGSRAGTPEVKVARPATPLESTPVATTPVETTPVATTPVETTPVVSDAAAVPEPDVVASTKTSIQVSLNSN